MYVEHALCDAVVMHQTPLREPCVLCTITLMSLLWLGSLGRYSHFLLQFLLYVTQRFCGHITRYGWCVYLPPKVAGIGSIYRGCESEKVLRRNLVNRDQFPENCGRGFEPRHRHLFFLQVFSPFFFTVLLFEVRQLVNFLPHAKGVEFFCTHTHKPKSA